MTRRDRTATEIETCGGLLDMFIRSMASPPDPRDEGAIAIELRNLSYTLAAGFLYIGEKLDRIREEDA